MTDAENFLRVLQKNSEVLSMIWDFCLHLFMLHLKMQLCNTYRIIQVIIFNRLSDMFSFPIRRETLVPTTSSSCTRTANLKLFVKYKSFHIPFQRFLHIFKITVPTHITSIPTSLMYSAFTSTKSAPHQHNHISYIPSEVYSNFNKASNLELPNSDGFPHTPTN